MQTPETFLCLTGTGWTAIGSIVSAISICVLSYFNYKNLGAAETSAEAAREGAAAAAEQAAYAKASLDALSGQFEEQKIIQKEIAILSLNKAAQSCRTWQASLGGDEYHGPEVKLIPSDWMSLSTFITAKMPGALGSLRKLQNDLEKLEAPLNSFIKSPRNLRAVVTVAYTNLSQGLTSAANDSDALALVVRQG